VRRPFQQEPLFRVWLAALIVPMGYAQRRRQSENASCPACLRAKLTGRKSVALKPQASSLTERGRCFLSRCQPFGRPSGSSAVLGGRAPDPAATPSSSMHPDNILQQQFLQSIAKAVVIAIGGVGQHGGPRHLFGDQSADLIQGHLGLGLKADFFRYPVSFLRSGSCAQTSGK